MKISKLDAARRQLESAIRLFFRNGDPIAIHTLAGGARGLLRDLAHRDGRETRLDQLLSEGIRPEHLSKVRSMLVEAQNFFKHANRDADALFDFNPATTEYLLWDCCLIYEDLTEQQLPLLAVMRVWFGLAHLDAVSAETRSEIGRLHPPGLDDRRAFCERMLPIAEQWISGAAEAHP